MFLSLFYNKYGATILMVVAVMAYCYIFKPASLFDAQGELKSKLITPELVALILGVCTYFAAEYLTRGSPQEVVVVGTSNAAASSSMESSVGAPAGPASIRRADALMSTPFTRRR